MPGAGRWKTKRPPKTDANGCWCLVPVLTGSFGHSATRRQDWIWLAGIILRLLFSLFPLSNYMAALLIIRDEWDISSSQAGLLNSLFADGALVIIPLADRVSPGNALAFSGITCAIGSLLFSLLASNVATGAPLRFLAFVLMTGGIIESADAAARAAIVVGAAGVLALTFLVLLCRGSGFSHLLHRYNEGSRIGQARLNPSHAYL